MPKISLLAIDFYAKSDNVDGASCLQYLTLEVKL
jgi:hypothetical protein